MNVSVSIGSVGAGKEIDTTIPDERDKCLIRKNSLKKQEIFL